ncbi:MAG: helix-turn-helix domain-containing protein [Clostridia bacterium]|nr:helix-turn-helix domain-containing protein [Clostridia bacterium]
MQKDTSEIVEQLQLSPDFQSFYQENKDYMVDKSLAELLEQLLKQSGISKSAAIKNAEMSETYGYHIFSGKRIPERGKVLALAIGMELNLEQVQQLLKAAGYSHLYVRRPFDSIVLYGICKKMTVAQINELLYDYGFDTLGQSVL